MNEVSKLSAASPVQPASNRVPRSPRKRKPGEHPAGKRRYSPPREDEEKQNAADPTGEERERETPEGEMPEENGERLIYGAGGFKKPRNPKVDLVI